MPSFEDISLMLSKTEVTPGVDPIPTPADNAILVRNLNPDVEAERTKREFDSPVFGSRGGVVGMKRVPISFTTELKGSGTANAGALSDAPEIDPLLQACGFALTATAESSGGAGDGDLTYDPVSTNQKPCTIYAYMGDVLHKIHYCLGNFSLDLEAGKFGVINWEFLGLYATPTDAAIPGGAVYQSTGPAPYVNAQLTLGGYSPKFEKFSFDMGNEVNPAKDANAATGIYGIRIGGRNISGSIDPEVVPEATNPFWSDWNASNGKALSTVVGATSGNMITITAPKIEYENLKYESRDKIRTYGIPLDFTQGPSGDDDIKIKFH